ncbi:MAG TPA: PAS domain S-box protein [Saliniramus sp.]|nr:PAS domain S-box protein [Saliniramus sp.]
MSARSGASGRPASSAGKQGRSLAWHLAMFGTGLLVPTFIFIAILMWQVAASERARYEGDARAIAQDVAAIVDGQLTGLLATVRALATDPGLAGPDYAAFEARAQRSLAEDRASVVLVDVEGRLLAQSGAHLDAAGAAGLGPQLRDMILAGQTVSNLISDADGMHRVAVLAPAAVRPDGTSLALLVPPSILLAIPRSSILEKSFQAALFDREGYMIAHSGDGEAVVGSLRLHELTLAMTETFTITMQGEPMIAGFSRSLVSNWTVLSMVPRAIARAPIVRTLTALVALGLALLTLVALFTFIFGRRAVTVAGNLRAAAASLGRGGMPDFRSSPVREANEVGEALSAAAIGLRERETALRENAAYLRRVLDNLPLFVGVLDLDGTLVEINAAPLKLTGLTREDLIGRKFWECQWWQSDLDVPARIREAVEAAREGRTSRFDVGALVRNGKVIIADFQIAPLRDAKGKVIALIPSAIDVNERERATRDLRESAERLRLALEAGQLGGWDLDIESSICIYSQRTCDMFGLTNPRITQDKFRELLHPDDRATVSSAIRRTVEEGAPYQAEFRLVRPDGEMRWIASQGLLRRNADGRPERIIGVHRDISARRRREEELQRSMELLRIIGETTPDLIVVKDARARYLFVNPAMARILGKDEAALLGATSLDGSLDQQEAALLHANDLRIMEEGRSQTIEESITIPGVAANAGATRTFLSTKTPMRDRLGETIGLVGVSTDITDRKRAEERQALMVRELHHRVKNSLATVQAIANSTARTATDIDSFREAFNQRVISLARTHTLLAENSWGVIPLRELMAAELDPYGGGDEMRVTLEGPEVALPSDVALSLGMAVHELTTNAFKYGALSSPGGSVAVVWRIETKDGSRQLRLTWIETGGPAVVQPSRQGFGSRLLRHMLGGQFNGEVEMTFEPDGLHFSVTIPLVEPAAAPVQAAQ